MSYFCVSFCRPIFSVIFKTFFISMLLSMSHNEFMDSAISQSLEGLVTNRALLYAISNVNIVTARYRLDGVLVIASTVLMDMASPFSFTMMIIGNPMQGGSIMYSSLKTGIYEEIRP